MSRSVILVAACTPPGKFAGLLVRFSAVEPGGEAIRAALERPTFAGCRMIEQASKVSRQLGISREDQDT